VAPADGKVVQVIPAAESEGLGVGATQLSIFLSVFDVHVNRAPVAGRVASAEYNPGQFLPAFDHKASERNEQTRIRLEGIETVVFKQIAGLIARRIVFRPKPGDRVERGERVGLIKFGSRVDVLLPAGFELRVGVGDRVSAGSSVIAEAVNRR
jgi:phosphatidylserine decarboxylase